MPSHHRSGGPIPLGDNQDVLCAECIDGFFELWSCSGIPAGGFLPKNLRASFRPKDAELPF